MSVETKSEEKLFLVAVDKVPKQLTAQQAREAYLASLAKTGSSFALCGWVIEGKVPRLIGTKEEIDLNTYFHSTETVLN